MANISMICHSTTPSLITESIQVEWEFHACSKLWVRYQVDCYPALLVLPEPADQPARTDGLWETTCFEMFLRNGEGPEYLEFNLSPSSQWAAYRFSDYRQDMRQLPMEPPAIWMDLGETYLALETVLSIPGLLSERSEAGFSAVLHEASNRKSYWALKHPVGKPDFHHKDCFAQKLAPPEHS